MAATVRGTPMYEDQLVAWHNQRLWWLLLAFLGLLALSIGDNVFYHIQPAPPPYVLEVNNKGDPVGQVLPVISVQAIPDAFLRARLAEFVHDAFTVDRDSDEEKYLYAKTEAMVAGQAAQKLDAWYNRENGKHHPEVVGPSTWVDASVTDTLKLAEKDTYQVDYVLTEHSNNNQTVTRSNWRAVLHVIVGRSKNPESLGLFIDNIDFNEVGK